MTIISYSRAKDRRKYNEEVIQYSRKALEKFPNLRKLLNNFKDFEKYYKIGNPFFWRCADSVRESILISKKYYHDKLIIMESAISRLKVDRHFISRARSNNYEDSYSAFCEIELFDALSKRVGIKNIESSPKINGKRPEFLLKTKFGDVCVEQTSMMPGKTEDKLKKVFESIAKEIHQKLNKNTMLSIHVDSLKLVWNEDTGLDVEKSIKKIIGSIEGLNLYSFFNLHNNQKDNLTWDLYMLSGLGKDKTLEEVQDTLKYYGSIGEYLSENINTEQCQLFIKNSTMDIDNCPIHSFFSLPNRYSVVQIQTRSIFPSEGAYLERNAWINRLKKKISSLKIILIYYS